MLDAGITPPFASQEVETIGTPDELVTTVVDVSAYVDVKIESLNCHRTQIDPNGPFSQLPEAAAAGVDEHGILCPGRARRRPTKTPTCWLGL